MFLFYITYLYNTITFYMLKNYTQNKSTFLGMNKEARANALAL